MLKKNRSHTEVTFKPAFCFCEKPEPAVKSVWRDPLPASEH